MGRILLFLLTIIFMGCSKSSLEEFRQDAVRFANDNFINEHEVQKLIKRINDSENNEFQFLKNENKKIDTSQFHNYLLKYLQTKNINLTIDNIWKSGNDALNNQFNINVYLENSASMDGYVKGVTEFETAIYNLLGDLKISGLCDSLNLNYINQTIPYKKDNALPADIQDFVEKLEPSVFKQRGGDRGSSDIKDILNTVLKTVDNKNAAILISDFVFSPGKNLNAQDFLNNQEVGIKIDFAEKLKEFKLSMIVIQLESKFDGIYYDMNNLGIEYLGKRPYYIWIFGSNRQIQSINDQKIIKNIKGGYLNKMVLQSTNGIVTPNFKILYSPKIGNFSAEHLNNKIISDASSSKNNQNKGIFGFTLAVDNSKSLQDDVFFLDIDNYSLSDPLYELKVESIIQSLDPSIVGFTHLLKLQTTNLREELLNIDVVVKTPIWVFNSTSIDDTNILNDSSEQQKTFGFKHLVEGVVDAFNSTSKSKVFNSIIVKIEK